MQGGQIRLNAANAASLGLADGRLYEITVFQAERNRTGSNYKLTLRGFEQKRTTCVSNCGDGIKTKFEACDDGANNDTNGPVDGGATVPPAYGKCSFDCRLRGGFCGDGIVQAGEGWLWVATQSGLARFDGVKFRDVPLSIPSRREHPIIRCQLLGQREELWLALEGGLVARLGKTVTKVFSPQ